jgi:S1-C subfamily serine protease
VTYVDVLLVLIVGSAALAGYRQGLVAAACSLLGAVVLALGAVTLAPILVRTIDSGLARTAVSMAVLLIGVLLGEFIGGWAGKVISEQITWSPAKSVDQVLGLVGQGVAVLFLSWVVATSLASAPIPTLTSAIRNSEILGAVNRVAPSLAEGLTDRLRALLNSTGFPDILGPLDATPIIDVPAPDSALLSDPAVAAARASVLKIRSASSSCGKSFTGSGFVIGPERVVTNAHVVGGSDRVTVEAGGIQLEASVVDFNPDQDLAVLLVPGLGEAGLPLDTAGLPGQADAIVLGYPEGGPFTVSPARVRSTTDLRGPNIYSDTTVERQVYLLRSDVRPGNSGGPLIDQDGEVVGVVFGAAVDDPTTAFALTAAEVAPTIAAGLTDTTPDDTQTCALR